MEVYALGQHIGGEDDVVGLRICPVVGIEVFLDGLPEVVAVSRCNHQYILSLQFLLDAVAEVGERIYTFGKHHKFARYVLVGGEKISLHLLEEKVKLGVGGFCFPFSIEFFKHGLVVAEHFDELWLESICLVHDVLPLIAFVHGVLDDLVELPAFQQKVLDLQVGSNDNLVLLEHAQHVVGDAEQGAK